VQEFATHDSNPTHPLGKRDSWPITGPIYGIPELDVDMQPTRTIWQWLVAGTSGVSEDIAARPGNPPIWY
jgi:hypothetical protein